MTKRSLSVLAVLSTLLGSGCGSDMNSGAKGEGPLPWSGGAGSLTPDPATPGEDKGSPANDGGSATGAALEEPGASPVPGEGQGQLSETPNPVPPPIDGLDALPCQLGVPATSQVPRLLNREYSAALSDLLGVSSVGGIPLAEALIADSTGPMTPDAWRIYMDVASKVAAEVMSSGTRSRFIECDPAMAGCLEATVRTFGRRAFRRPLTEQEVERFLALGDTSPPGTPEQVAETTLNAFLVSPSFLTKAELGQEPLAGGLALTSHEIATRLSFMLWGTVPDAMLNAAADADQLTTAQAIAEQAARMSANREKTSGVISAFHREWSQMNNEGQHWFSRDHDPALFPLYEASKKISWKAELNRFFEEVAYSDGGFKDLLLSSVAFVNTDNAEIYGLDPAAYGPELVKEVLDPTERPGFLTRAGFLSSYADYDSTSPILRGAFISVFLLGVNPGAPAPGATETKVEGEFSTKRAYVEALTRPPECVGCHSVVNPAGFVLEAYDAIGKLQSVDQRYGGPIDATVTTAKVPFGGSREVEVSSALQLMEEIASTPRAMQQYASAWVSYALGRPPNESDNCLANQLHSELAQNGRILDVLPSLSQAESMRVRVREN